MTGEVIIALAGLALSVGSSVYISGYRTGRHAGKLEALGVKMDDLASRLGRIEALFKLTLKDGKE